jgi:hypothetical protein
MKKAVLVAVVIGGLVGCGGGGVVTITLDPSSASLTIGQTVRFIATVSGTPNDGVDWSASSGQLIAKNDGATFVATEPGTFDITATSRARSDVTAVVTVTVAALPGKAHVRFVSDSSMLLASQGSSATLAVEVVDADGQLIEGGQVTWSSSDPASASVIAAGDRSATITTETATTSQAVITATYGALSADASVLISDPFSDVVPYAAVNTALVSVTEEEEEPDDRGPLGNEGPFRGTATYFSLGSCNATGAALTIEFFEQPDGSLTGTYDGHYCSTVQSCIEIDPYPTGPLSGSLSGQRTGDDVTFTLSAPLGGVFTGVRFVPTAPPGSSSLPFVQGLFDGMVPCVDSYGSHFAGLYNFVGTQSIPF